MSTILHFAVEFLDNKELELAEYLSRLLENPKYIFAGVLVSEILPTYSEKCGKSTHTLEPDPIYRPLYYLHMQADTRHFKARALRGLAEKHGKV